MTQISSQEILAFIGPPIRRYLYRLLRQTGRPLWLSGGSVRDVLLGKHPTDIDLTVEADAKDHAARLAEVSGGTQVALGRGEDAARVVIDGTVVDLASFREGATTIEQDLQRRDLTVNALAVRIDPLVVGQTEGELNVLDPTGGVQDLHAALVRMTGPLAFTADPLRLLRVFRFAAVLGFEIDGVTLTRVGQQRQDILRVSVERIQHELDILFSCPIVWPVIEAMGQTGLLTVLLPDLGQGLGMTQPASHHLDVYHHSLEALRQVERLLSGGSALWGEGDRAMVLWLGEDDNRRLIRWAALLHDIGKPVTKGERQGRITFHGHEQRGMEVFDAIAARYRWRGSDRRRVGQLIALHMRPFHLLNVARQEPLSSRACLRLIRAIDHDLPGLFLLAMADALAGKGEDKPIQMEQEVAELFRRLDGIYREQVQPVRSAPPLVTGHDLIERFGLEPGPRFKELLAAVEEEQMQGTVRDRDQALLLIRDLLAATEETELR